MEDFFLLTAKALLYPRTIRGFYNTEKRVFRRALVMRFVVDQNVALEKARSVLSKSAGSAVYPPALGKEMLGPR